MTLETAYRLFRARVLSWARLAGATESDAEDIAQAVFQSFERNRRRIGERAVSAWLYRATRNETRRHMTKIRRRRDHEAPAAGEHPSPEPSQEHALGGFQAEAVLLGLVDRLEPKRREVFVRHVIGEEPMEAIAAAQGVPLQTAWKRLVLAREELQEAVKRERARERRTARGSTSFALLPFLSSLFTRRRCWALASPMLGAAAVLLTLLLVDAPELAPLVMEAPARQDVPIFTPAVSLAEAPRELDAAQAGEDEQRLDLDAREAPRDVMPADVAELSEHMLVALARRALAEGSPSRARGFLARAARAYPRGSLLPERAALAARTVAP